MKVNLSLTGRDELILVLLNFPSPTKPTQPLPYEPTFFDKLDSFLFAEFFQLTWSFG